MILLNQTMQPTPLHLTVKEYVEPEKFAFWKDFGESIGFRYVASGPLVCISKTLIYLNILSVQNLPYNVYIFAGAFVV